MRISNRVRRNISFGLLMVGVACVIARAWDVAREPSSGHAWFELCGIIIITYICLGRFRVLQHRVRRGITYGA